MSTDGRARGLDFAGFPVRCAPSCVRGQVVAPPAPATSNRACGSPAHGSPTPFTARVRLLPPGLVGSGCDDGPISSGLGTPSSHPTGRSYNHAAGFASRYGALGCTPLTERSTLGFDPTRFRRDRQPATGPLSAIRTGLPPASEDEPTSQSSTTQCNQPLIPTGRTGVPYE